MKMKVTSGHVNVHVKRLACALPRVLCARDATIFLFTVTPQSSCGRRALGEAPFCSYWSADVLL